MSMMSERAIMYYYDHPAEFTNDIIGAVPEDHQAKILNSLVTEPMTSVRSGHGVGKSAVEAWAIIWFLVTRPYPKIPCTAPTQHQLFDILWAEVSKWRRNSKFLEHELIWTNEKLYMRGHKEEWFAVARTASKPDALQGFHSENLLYIIDEASGVDDKIFEPVLGSMSTKGARLLMCGNPTQLSGFFYDSHNRNRASYKTFHIDGSKSARVSDEYVKKIIDMYGKNSDVYRVRVAGDFPLAADDVFIPISLLEQCGSSLYELQQRSPILAIGCDVARYGDDETTIYRNDRGVLKLAKHYRGQDLMWTVGEIVNVYKWFIEKYPNSSKKVYVNIDDTGLGGGVTDRLKEVKVEQHLHRMKIIPINAAGKIETDSVAGREEAEHYNNLTTAMWANVRTLCKNKEIQIEDDDETFGQASVRKYRLASNGKIELESKDSMKKRGVGSPDRADALALSCYLGKIKRFTGSLPGDDTAGMVGKDSYWNRD